MTIEELYSRDDCCDTFKIIPPKEINRVFEESNRASSEMDFTFLCFEDEYKKVSKHCNKNTVVIDFGCAYAAQSYWFEFCEKYIGVDSDLEVHFKTHNSEFYEMTGQEFIEKVLPALNINLENTIAVCSYVPDEELQKQVAEKFPNNYVVYCNDIISEKLPKIQPQKIFNMLDLFYANKHMYEKLQKRQIAKSIDIQ